MTQRAKLARGQDVLAFDTGPHRFAIAASAVAYVHDGAPLDAPAPLVDLASVFGVDDVDDARRTIRVRSRHGDLDVCAGNGLRVTVLERTTPVPAWLAEGLRAIAIGGVSIDDESLVFLLDVDALHGLAPRPPEGPRA